MNEVYDPKGVQLLKLSGLLMILFGALGCLLYTLGLAAVLGVSYVTSGIFKVSSDLWGMGLLLTGALVELIAGILGRKAASHPQRAGGHLYIWGILSMILSLAGLVDVLLRGGSLLHWLSLPLSLAVPVVFLLGAAKILRGPIDADEAEE